MRKRNRIDAYSPKTNVQHSTKNASFSLSTIHLIECEENVPSPTPQLQPTNLEDNGINIRFTNLEGNDSTLVTKNPSTNVEQLPPTLVINSPSTNDEQTEQRRPKTLKTEKEKVDISSLPRDPALRRQMWDYHIDQCDEIRRFYITAGPYQPRLSQYKLSSSGKQLRHFQPSWYDQFPSWLEYSDTIDAVFCLPCYVFSDRPNARFRTNTFIVDGFKAWKKVKDGKHCTFLVHMGKSPNSQHNACVKSCDALMAQSQHIERSLNKQCSQIVMNNRLRLKTSIDVVRWLTFQGCAFRGNDENIDSLNRNNFIEMVKLLVTYDENVANVVLENAPGNTQYISPSIQKEILYIFARRIRSIIREDIIGNAKYCIIIDEFCDGLKREQMSIVLKFVDKKGCVQEKFFDLVHVLNTTALTLKEEITSVLSRHNFNICNIRSQGYDGVSNMRGEWNGLQALFLKECPFAYYIHCLAHRLQLALVAAAREVSSVHQFCSKLTFIVNIVSSSPKRHNQLIEAHGDHIAYLIANDKLETGKGLNQQGTLKQAGDTRWGSHLASIQSLLCMRDATCHVLQTATKEGKYAQQGDADSAYDSITSFEFIHILHVMKNILGITRNLCQALQCKSQDILNAISLVSTTKILIQNLRESGWETLFNEVKMFCEKHNVEIPDLNAPYFPGRSCRRAHDVSIEHHYRVNLFISIIDTQLQELNSRFSDSMMELLSLSSTLDLRDNFKLLIVDHICELANKFYPDNFSEQEKLHLRIQAQHYELDVPYHYELKQLSTISKLCQGLVKTRKSLTYHLIDRLIRLVLTLPVSTATSERSFSAMKIIKNRLRNRMEDEYLADCLITYTVGRIAEKFDTDSIIDEFDDIKERRALLRLQH